MRALIVFALLLTGCAAEPVGRTPVVFEVHKARQCPSLPLLSDNATVAERTAYTRQLVALYAQCAKGD